MPTTDVPAPPIAPPVWVRAAPVCSWLGLTPDLLEAAASRGELPIRVTRLGPKGLLFAHGGDVARYLERMRGTLPARGIV